jgi:7-cyano-7-deazaguanine reductase
MRKQSSQYEGLQGKVRTLKTPAIEVWRNQYADKAYTIHLDVPEFTCICPKTGLPDFARIVIQYCPGQNCVELKSFKYYINQYRSIGIFHEHVINRILEDFVRACKPRWVHIRGEFNSRGGIQTTVECAYGRKKT